MKRNYMMRFASLLLALVLVTCCVVSGTFAKYTAGGNANDSATVAKWGVTVTVTGNDAFSKKYDLTSVEGSIVSSLTNKTLAPGTKGTLGSVEITGTPEVKVSRKVELTVELNNWKVDNTFYCPLTIKCGDNTLEGTNYNTAEEFIIAIKGLVDLDDTVEANESTGYSKILTWEWKYSTSTENDTKDTKLTEGNLPTFTVSWVATVTQLV